MSTTTFSKPIDTEIAALNNKIETYNLGTDTLANIQSVMVSYVSSSMSDFSVKNVRFTPTAATGIFKVLDYIGTIHRIYATRFTVEARNKENDLILGEYDNGTWSWQSLNSKIIQYGVVKLQIETAITINTNTEVELDITNINPQISPTNFISANIVSDGGSYSNVDFLRIIGFVTNWGHQRIIIKNKDIASHTYNHLVINVYVKW